MVTILIRLVWIVHFEVHFSSEGNHSLIDANIFAWLSNIWKLSSDNSIHSACLLDYTLPAPEEHYVLYHTSEKIFINMSRHNLKEKGVDKISWVELFSCFTRPIAIIIAKKLPSHQMLHHSQANFWTLSAEVNDLFAVKMQLFNIYFLW